MTEFKQEQLKIQTVKISELNPATYNPRKWSDEAIAGLRESIQRYSLVEPILANSAENRKNVVIGGHFRIKVAKDLGITEVPVVYVNIPDEAKEKELNLRLNKNVGEFDFDLLAEFDETLLADIGFSSEELDTIFSTDVLEEPDNFNLTKELEKLDIKEITVQKGDVYQLGSSRLMCGDSTVPEDFAKLMNDEKADMCMTDMPYRLSYLKGGVRHGKPAEGFGAKRNRKYLETDELPEDFVEKWMQNVADHAKPDFSIISYEAWHNLPEQWREMEKHWKVKNMLIWHLKNRHQGFAAKYKFFSKYDIALVGGGGNVEYNHGDEGPLQETYETALFAIQGKPHWEGYEHGKKALLQPTDHIEFNADDEKHSGQNIVFGTKPIEILIPYIKFLTRRNDIVVEPFCGSGSTLIASTRLERRCFVMEKVPTYAEVAIGRWEKETGLKRELVLRANQDAQNTKDR